jgi:hypothetical protein
VSPRSRDERAAARRAVGMIAMNAPPFVARSG